MKLLQEISEDIEYVTEAREDGKKNLYISGVFLQCIPNRNGRIYPEEVMHKEVKRYLAEKVDRGQAFGELDHPPNPKLNLDRTSHRIVSLKIEGKNVMGKALILDTDMGRNARGIIEGGGKLGVSSRGLGSLKENENGLKEVQSDFHLVTAADIVSDPSAPDAWVEGIMEGVEWFCNPVTGEWKAQVAEDYRKSIKKMTTKQLNEAKYRLFAAFLEEVATGSKLKR